VRALTETPALDSAIQPPAMSVIGGTILALFERWHSSSDEMFLPARPDDGRACE
jgi:hypothetical protein